MQQSQSQYPKVLTLFSLVMINVIAVDSLRTLPISAKFGFSLITYYLLCTLFFLVPVGLVSAELATTWPKRGGIYIWVREAFGSRMGFLVVWLQWVYNVVWYPTILGFVAATAAEVFDPSLLQNKIYVVCVVLLVFWGATLVNYLGMRASSFLSTVGSIVGTLFPMVLIIVLGIIWIVGKHPIQIEMSWNALLPKWNHVQDLVLITAILFGLMGLEMSSVHAQEVKDPKTHYPRALWISGILIVVSLVCSSLAVAIVVPPKELSLVTGMIQAFRYFFEAFHLAWFIPFIAAFMIIGAIGSVATWIIGPTKGLLAAAEDGSLPQWLGSTNKKGVPVNILLCQASIVTLLSLAYVLLPTVESSYWALTALTAILALLMYVLMFVAAVRLRYTHARIERPYRIPGGQCGIWIVSASGLLTSVGAILLGFVPPSDVSIQNVQAYIVMLFVGTLLFCVPAFFLRQKKRSFTR